MGAAASKVEEGKKLLGDATSAISSATGTNLKNAATNAAAAAKIKAEGKLLSQAVSTNKSSQNFIESTVEKVGGIEQGAKNIKSAIEDPSISWGLYVIGGIVAVAVLALIGWGIYKAIKATKGTGVANDPEKAAGELAAAFEKFQNQDSATEGFQSAGGTPPTGTEETPFVALQPLTLRQAGYLGPYDGGKFDPKVAVANALRAGFRSFVLQIDSLDNVKKGFAEPGVPTLVYRSDSGTLMSSNSGSIQDVAEAIATFAYKPEFPNSSKPVILYLHILRTPSPVREPEKYKLFLSQIATQLEPLAPSHLGMTPSGTFHRQKQEDVLLNVPLRSLEGKTIILCNADTKIFRSPKMTESGERISPKQDLDFWVNMRVYLENEDAILGVTQIPESDVKPAAVITRIKDLIALSKAKADGFAIKGRKRFVIALPSQTLNPTPAVLAGLLNEFGVNMVPLDIFSEPMPEILKLVRPYEKQSYRGKPLALRGGPVSTNVPA